MPVTTAASRSEDPLQTSRFAIEFDRTVAGLVISCDGLESKSEITEAFSGGKGGKERPASRTPGKLSFSPLQLKLFVLKGDNYFESWFRQVQDGQLKGATRDGTIKLYDTEDKPVAEWTIRACWPSQVSYSDLDAESNEALSLTVTLVYEDFTREQ
jgi:phage tail-like protein